jgi:hypothetical protein
MIWVCIHHDIRHTIAMLFYRDMNWTIWCKCVSIYSVVFYLRDLGIGTVCPSIAPAGAYFVSNTLRYERVSKPKTVQVCLRWSSISMHHCLSASPRSDASHASIWVRSLAIRWACQAANAWIIWNHVPFSFCSQMRNLHFIYWLMGRVCISQSHLYTLCLTWIHNTLELIDLIWDPCMHLNSQ